MKGKIAILFCVGLIIGVAGTAYAESLPNPYRHADQPIIGPAPVPVMEQEDEGE